MAPMPTPDREPPFIPPSWLLPAADGAGLEVELFPSVLMLAAGTLFQRNIFRPLLEPSGLGVADWRVLLSLNHYGDATAAEIVARSWMDKGQVSRAALALEQAGLIERRPDPAHAKKVILSSTKKGNALYARLHAQAQREQARLLTLLTADERRGLYLSLQKIIRHTQGLQP